MSASCEQGITLAGDLHARPAGALAVAAGRFASAVSVTAGGNTADAKSVLGVMGLGATGGQHVTVAATGLDAREAVAALITILGEATKVGGLLCRHHHLCKQAEGWRLSQPEPGVLIWHAPSGRT
jgi:phosphocarrier protein HPr